MGTQLPSKRDATRASAEARSQARFRLVYVNDISFILDTLHAELAKQGIDCRIVGRRSSDPSVGRNSYIQNVRAIQTAIRGIGEFDILHINYGFFGIFAIRSDKPVVLHCHGSDVRPGSGLKSKIANLVTKLGARTATRVWYSTTDLARYFLNLKTPHRYMPNPVAPAFFRPSPSLPARPHVLFAVPLAHVKGAEIAVEAMRMLTEKTDIPISAFGYTSRYPESHALRQRIPNSVTLLPWTPRHRMPSLFSEATVVVGGLRIGALGITELEAMATGRPVVTYLDGSVRKTGSYYRSEPPILSASTPHEVVDAVESCLADGSRAQRLGHQSQEWARTYHSVQVVASAYRQEYCELVQS